MSRIRSISIVEEELKNVEEFIIGDKECLKIFPGYLPLELHLLQFECRREKLLKELSECFNQRNV